MESCPICDDINYDDFICICDKCGYIHKKEEMVK
jgi:hypothetical protein